MNARRLFAVASLAMLILMRHTPAQADGSLSSGQDNASVASPTHFADADDAAQVHAGRELYRTHCARCHGRRLEGQPLWQLNDQFAHQRAPAHDETGHTWQHADEELFQITRSGRLPGMPDGAKSSMPAFAHVLNDAQILQVLAFIKARWSVGIRVSQATLNPGFAGMPAGADQVEWTLPPNCTGALQSWRVEASRQSTPSAGQ